MHDKSAPRPDGLAAALTILRVARFLVPGHLRQRWLAEWRAELWHRARSGQRTLPRALVAIPHAAALRRQHWSTEVILQDLRYAVRQVFKSPGLSAVVVLTLALGIGANSLVFSVLDTTVLNPLPFEDADRLVYLWNQHPTYRLMLSPSVEAIRMWRETLDAFESIELVTGNMVTTKIDGEPVRIQGTRTSVGFFDFLRARPALGRTFAPDEGIEGNDRVVILSHGLWQRYFGGDAGVLGQQIRLDKDLFTVIGVMPRSFRLQPPFANAEIWTPLIESDDVRGVSAMARLAPGVSIELANEQLQSLGDADDGGMTGWSGVARSQQDMAGGRYATALWALQGAVVLVLLISCSNVANLLLARGAVRRREMAVRAAIGGSRGRLVRQMLTETLLLAMAGGTLGLLIAALGVQLIDSLRPEELRYLVTLRLDERAVGGTLAISLLVGLTVGLLPALRTSGGRLAAELADGARGGTAGSSRHRLGSGLVVTQVALSTLLLVGAGLMAHTFLRYQAIDPGFDPNNLLTLRVTPPEAAYPKETRQAYWEKIRQRVRTALGPRATHVMLAPGVPPDIGVEIGKITAEGQEAPPAGKKDDELTAVLWGDEQTLPTLRLPLLSGRWLTREDIEAENQRVVINEAFASSYWPGEEAVGKRYRIGEGEEDPAWRTVVGVVGNVRPFGLNTDMGWRQTYYPLHLSEQGSLMLVIRTPGDPLEIVDTVRQAVWSVEPDAPITDLSLVADRLGETIALPRFNALMMLVLAATAVGLALIGVYGVLSYSVADRTRELGLRMALGAKRPDVILMVARQGAWLVGIGAVLGLVGALALGQTLTSMLYGVTPSDPATFAITAAVLALVGLIASWIPALRATRVDPMEALRSD